MCFGLAAAQRIFVPPFACSSSLGVRLRWLAAVVAASTLFFSAVALANCSPTVFWTFNVGLYFQLPTCSARILIFSRGHGTVWRGGVTELHLRRPPLAALPPHRPPQGFVPWLVGLVWLRLFCGEYFSGTWKLSVRAPAILVVRCGRRSDYCDEPVPDVRLGMTAFRDYNRQADQDRVNYSMRY